MRTDGKYQMICKSDVANHPKPVASWRGSKRTTISDQHRPVMSVSLNSLKAASGSAPWSWAGRRRDRSTLIACSNSTGFISSTARRRTPSLTGLHSCAGSFGHGTRAFAYCSPTAIHLRVTAEPSMKPTDGLLSDPRRKSLATVGDLDRTGEKIPSPPNSDGSERHDVDDSYTDQCPICGRFIVFPAFDEHVRRCRVVEDV